MRAEVPLSATLEVGRGGSGIVGGGVLAFLYSVSGGLGREGGTSISSLLPAAFSASIICVKVVLFDEVWDGICCSSACSPPSTGGGDTRFGDGDV